MKTNNKNKYTETKDAHGNEILCPFADEQEHKNGSKMISDDCFEKDVAERYSGNIDIVGRDV